MRSKKTSIEKLAFRKFKLVPVNEAYENEASEVRGTRAKELEDYLQKYNPTVRAMAHAYEGMENALIAKPMQRTPTERLNLLSANRAKLLQLMQRNDMAPAQKAYQQPLPKPDENSLLATPTSHSAPVPVPKSPAAPPNLAIPKRHKEKFEQLIEKVSEIITYGNDGQVVIHGRSLNNTSFSDIMRALYVDSKFTVPGLSETVAELKRNNVPPRLITSSRARTLYTAADSNVGRNRSQVGSGKRRCEAKNNANINRKFLRLY